MRRLTSLMACGLAWMLLLTVPPEVRAQQFTGGLRGAIRDAAGVIPGVAVTLVNEETTAARNTVSNEAGEYLFSAVNPGTYTLRAVLQGFKTFDQKGIRIGTQQFITLDIIMEVGQIAEELTVRGQAPLIETSNASLGASIGREALQSLPSPGRSAFTMAVTIPTVNPVGDPQFQRQQDRTNLSRVSLGGGGIRANNYLVDGVAIANLPGLPAVTPTIESIDEVKVQVHTYDAEIGRAGGGVFNTTAKTGANAFHGSGFYQTRPIWGQSLNYFDDVAGRTKEQTGLAKKNFQLYGGGLGGPILRNRTFFWTATENYHTTNLRACCSGSRPRGSRRPTAGSSSGSRATMAATSRTTGASIRRSRSTIIDAQSFGSIVSQAGFMRIFQLAYRYRF